MIWLFTAFKTDLRYFPICLSSLLTACHSFIRLIFKWIIVWWMIKRFDTHTHTRLFSTFSLTRSHTRTAHFLSSDGASILHAASLNGWYYHGIKTGHDVQQHLWAVRLVKIQATQYVGLHIIIIIMWLLLVFRHFFLLLHDLFMSALLNDKSILWFYDELWHNII